VLIHALERGPPVHGMKRSSSVDTLGTPRTRQAEAITRLARLGMNQRDKSSALQCSTVDLPASSAGSIPNVAPSLILVLRSC
jgi:hypothetical protein